MQQTNHPLTPTYLDFDLEISAGSAPAYPVTVRSPAGEARATMQFPFDPLTLEGRLKDLRIALLQSTSTTRRKVLQPEQQAVQDFGQQLYDALFQGNVRSRYDLSLEQATQHNQRLRVRLNILPPDLAALPWEFLYDSQRGEFLCLNDDTPLVRYLELSQPVAALPVAPPLRILAMLASPNGLPTLDLQREYQRMEQALRATQARHQIELVWLEGQTPGALQRALRNGPWHIFHFIGHGGFDHASEEGFIALADEEGELVRFSATQLARMLGGHRALRLAVLNACEGARNSYRDIFSSTATTLIRRGIPAVLAMQYEISDRAAITFARAFYEALAEAMPIDGAVTEARKAISFATPNTVEWGTPVLYMRARDGRLFTLTNQPAPAPANRHLTPSSQAGSLAINGHETRTIETATTTREQLDRMLSHMRAAHQRKDWAQVYELGEQVRQLDPADTQVPLRMALACWNMGLIEHTQGNDMTAIAHYTRALELDATKPDYFCDRGRSLVRLGKLDEALHDFNRAIGLNTKEAEYYFERGQLAYDQGNNDWAVVDFARAIALRPQHAPYHYYRGLGQRKRGKFDQAVIDYTRAIDLKPDEAIYYVERGHVFHTQGHELAALRDYGHAIEMDPHHAHYYYLRGATHERLGNRGAAQIDFQQAAELGHAAARRVLRRPNLTS